MINVNSNLNFYNNINNFFEVENSIVSSQESDISNSINSLNKNLKKRKINKKDSEFENSLINDQFNFLNSCNAIKKDDFFVNCQPTEWFPFLKSENGSIEVNWSSNIDQSEHSTNTEESFSSDDSSKKEKIIYIFRNKSKNKVLIGKTERKLKKRVSEHLNKINTVVVEKFSNSKRHEFFQDFRQNPADFEIGVLYSALPEEDLNHLEQEFIKHKAALYQLYNTNKGGGGGVSHSGKKETVFAVPKNETTPSKYYAFKKLETGIAPVFSPGLKRRVDDQIEEGNEVVYSIKKSDTKRYIGVTNNIFRRSKEHAYAANRQDPNHENYDPNQNYGYIHEALAKSPENFKIGVFSIQPLSKINPEEWNSYHHIKGIANVEKYMIKNKESLFSQNGYNGNGGGGGPVSSQCLFD